MGYRYICKERNLLLQCNMGCYFYIQDRGVHTLGEEIRRMDMGLWPLLSRMYRVSCEEESHEMHLLLRSQTLRLEIHAPAHGGGRGMRTAQPSTPQPPLGARVHSTLCGREHGWVWLSRVFLATAVVSLLPLSFPLCTEVVKAVQGCAAQPSVAVALL